MFLGYIFVTREQMGRYDVGGVRLWGYRIKAEHHVVLRFGLLIACLLK